MRWAKAWSACLREVISKDKVLAQPGYFRVSGTCGAARIFRATPSSITASRLGPSIPSWWFDHLAELVSEMNLSNGSLVSSLACDEADTAKKSDFRIARFQNRLEFDSLARRSRRGLSAALANPGRDASSVAVTWLRPSRKARPEKSCSAISRITRNCRTRSRPKAAAQKKREQSSAFDSGFCPERADEFRGGDGLAQMALGVVGQVDQQPADGRGQLFRADDAGSASNVFAIDARECRSAARVRLESSSASTSSRIALVVRFRPSARNLRLSPRARPSV